MHVDHIRTLKYCVLEGKLNEKLGKCTLEMLNALIN